LILIVDLLIFEHVFFSQGEFIFKSLELSILFIEGLSEMGVFMCEFLDFVLELGKLRFELHDFSLIESGLVVHLVL